MRIEQIGLGMRLWDSHSGDHCKVVKINAKTVGVQYENGDTANLPAKRLETSLFPAQEQIKKGDKVYLTVRLQHVAKGTVGTVEADHGATMFVLFEGRKQSLVIRRKELMTVRQEKADNPATLPPDMCFSALVDGIEGSIAIEQTEPGSGYFMLAMNGDEGRTRSMFNRAVMLNLIYALQNALAAEVE